MEKPAVTKTPQEQSLNASQTNSPLSTNLKHKRTVSIVHHENDVESQGKNLENGISKPIVLATSEDNLEHLDDAQEVELNSSLKRKSSINSQNSSINVLSYYMDKIGNLYLDWLETSIMSYLILKANNCQTKILFWMLITALPGLINIIVVLVFFNRELNSIYDSNLIQIVLGFSGHAVVLATYKLQEIIATAIIGDELVRGTATVDMVTKKQGARIPSSNAKMRFVIITSAFAYDAAVIAICVFLSWRNITTNLPGKDKDGKYPCIPAKYTQNFTVPTLFKLGDFLEGKIDVSTIQQDALPLSDGLIGGFGAWPLFLPPNVLFFNLDTSPLI